MTTVFNPLPVFPYKASHIVLIITLYLYPLLDFGLLLAGLLPCFIALVCFRISAYSSLSLFVYIFLMAAAAILDFQIFEILTVGTLKIAKLRPHAKFSPNRPIKPRPRYCDLSIFPRWRPSAILVCDACVRTTHERHLVVFVTVQNLVGIDRPTVVSIICNFLQRAAMLALQALY